MKTRILPILFVLTAIVSGGCRPATSPHVEMSPGEQIVKAIADNDAAMVRSLLAKTPELIRETDKRGTTLLHYAARVSTDPAVLQALLDAGADLNARDDKDWPPVYCALYHRNKPATEFLLKQKVDAASYPDTKTLIENAVRWNADAGALRILLANHHENWVVTSLTLTAARFNDDPEVMRLLLEHGGDPNASEMHTTVMHYAAAKSPDVKTLQYLLDRKAKIDPRPSETDENAPNTPLHYAAKNNPKVEISQWLIEHGADPFAKNNGGETPCDYAVRYNSNIDVVQIGRAHV